MKKALLALLLTACTIPVESETIGTAEQALDKCETVLDCSFIPVAPCSRPACDDGVCIQSNTPNGEAADVPQIHGDCTTLVCDKLDVVPVVETHDIPFPAWECARSYCREDVPVIEQLPCLDPSAPE